jgi:hypothetical protein
MFTFVYLPTPFCQIRTLPNSQGNNTRSAFPNWQLNTTAPGRHSQIGNSAQQRQVGIPKLPSQHNSARSAFPNWQLNTTAPGRHSQIGNSTQQCKVGIPKLPTQQYYFA